jgi:hypothetical protein
LDRTYSLLGGTSFVMLLCLILADVPMYMYWLLAKLKKKRNSHEKWRWDGWDKQLLAEQKKQ